MSQYCPSCGAQLPAASAASGEYVRCGKCGFLSEMKAGFGQPANYPPQPTAYQQPAGYQPTGPAGSPPAGYGQPSSYQTPFQPQAPSQFSDQYSPPGCLL